MSLNFELYLQLVLDGIANGATYGFLALGFVMIYRASKVLNFAQAGTGGFGAYILYWLMRDTGGAVGRYVAVFAVGVLVATLLGVATERVAVRPLRRAPLVASLVVTVGVLLLIQAVIVILFGGDLRSIPNPLPASPVEVGRVVGFDQVRISSAGVITLALMLVAGFGLSVLVHRTRWGLAVRAVSDDLEAASECGVPVSRISATAWALGTAVGAVGSMLFASATLLNPLNLAFLQMKAIVVAVFAGLTDLRLCVVGGLLLGVIESLAGRLGSNLGLAGLDQSMGFFVLVALLLARSRSLTEALEDARAS